MWRTTDDERVERISAWTDQTFDQTLGIKTLTCISIFCNNTVTQLFVKSHRLMFMNILICFYRWFWNSDNHNSRRHDSSASSSQTSQLVSYQSQSQYLYDSRSVLRRNVIFPFSSTLVFFIFIIVIIIIITEKRPADCPSSDLRLTAVSKHR